LYFNTHAQFTVDTLTAVEISSKKIKPVMEFSTFSKKLIGGNVKTWMKTNGDFFCPLAVRVVNSKGYKVRIDSIDVKSENFDTNKVKFSINLFYSGALKDQSRITGLKRNGKVYSFKLVHPLILPADTSYLSYSFSLSEETNFFIYTNSKIEGSLYSYNKDRNEFQIIEDNDLPFLGAPQFIIHYTTLWNEP